MKKAGVIFAVVLAATLTACGTKEGTKDTTSGTSSQSEENGTKEDTTKAPVKPTGNMVMKDEAGNVVMTIDDVESVEATQEDNGSIKEDVVSIIFTDEGAKKFKKVTEDNIGKKLEIYVDDELVSAPIVNEIITSGETVISGSLTSEKAESIANKIQG